MLSLLVIAAASTSAIIGCKIALLEACTTHCGLTPAQCGDPRTCVNCGMKNLATTLRACGDHGVAVMETACGVVRAPTSVTLDGLGEVAGFVPSSSSLGTRVFRGIPYAAPPVGDKRWREAQPPVAWSPGVLNATDFSASCPQLGPGWPSLGIEVPTHISEDCLYLNVYAPPAADFQKHFATASPGKKGFPVMLYFPAGQDIWGSGADLENLRPFPGFELTANANAATISAHRGAVVVTMNYRLGALGWLALPELRSRSVDNSTGNYGTTDQRAVLQWIQKHISKFGGDPNSVVLWGESAGASAVSAHLVFPKSQGLFHRAVIESGAFNTWTYKTWEDAEANARSLAAKVGCNQTGDALVTCLLNTTAQSLAFEGDAGYGDRDYVVPYSDGMDKCAWAAVIDGVELTKTPIELMNEGGVAPGVELIVGTNRDEGSTFVLNQSGTGDHRYTADSSYHHFASPAGVVNDGDFAAFCKRVWGTDAMIPFYNYTMFPRTPDVPGHHGGPSVASDPWWRISRIVGDFVLTCPTRRAARSLSKQGHSVYVYYFNHTPSYTVNVDEEAVQLEEGCFHGSDVPYFWLDDFELPAADELALSAAIATRVTNFAWSGNPNVDAYTGKNGSEPWVQWPAYGAGAAGAASGGLTEGNIVFGPVQPQSGGAQNVSVMQGLHSEACDWWDAWHEQRGAAADAHARHALGV